MKRRDFIVAGCLIGLIAASPIFAAVHRPRIRPVTSSGPTVSFDHGAIVISAHHPGATFYLAGLSLSDTPFDLRIERNSTVLHDTGSGGDLRFEPAGGLRSRGVWLVVDGSGGYTLAPPPGFALRQFDVSPQIFADASANRERITVDRHHIELFLVRPGTGLWRADVKDGSKDDEDHSLDGRVVSSVSTFISLSGTPAGPQGLVPGDVVVGIDHNTLEFFVTKVEKP